MLHRIVQLLINGDIDDHHCLNFLFIICPALLCHKKTIIHTKLDLLVSGIIVVWNYLIQAIFSKGQDCDLKNPNKNEYDIPGL
jgi:hypothetical protein